MTNRGGSGDGGRATKAERKEEARLQRLEIHRRAAKRRRTRGIAFAAIVAVAIVVAVFVATRPKSKEPTTTATLPGMLTASQPWPNNTADLAARLDKIGLPDAGGAMHIHGHVDIYVNGTAVPVPADIGIGQNVESSLHTHSADGVVHMEAASQATFTLGQLFDVWGVRFTPTCLGGYCNASGQTLQIFVNGKPYTGDPRGLAFQDHQEIVVAYGTPAQLPNPIPASFDWANANL